MTQDRAQYIIKHYIPCVGLRFRFHNEFTGKDARQICEDGITEQEHWQIHLVWSLMSSNKSYYDAVKAIAEGI